LVLSVASRTVIHADCQDVEVDLRRIEIHEGECFGQALVSTIVNRYIPDVIASVPLLVGSLSLIGCPMHVIKEAIRSARAAWATARTEGDSVLVGIGRGSVNLLRGITTGSLESLISLANSLDTTITWILEGRGEPQERTRGIGRSLLEMAAIPVGTLLTFVKATGGMVLRKVGQPEARVIDPREKKALVLLDLTELADTDEQ
jgi:hypothetical protein